MKLRHLLTLFVTPMFVLSNIPTASADGMTSEENSIAMNVIYAEQILYCDSALNFKKYELGQFFDNNGACIDTSPAFADGADGWAALQNTYKGGIYHWRITADNGQMCWFSLYHGDPNPDPQVLVWDTFFTACSVRLNRPVNDKWVMVDYEFPESSPVFEKCADTVQPFTDYENNCLSNAYFKVPNNLDVKAGTIVYINKAANILKKKFYAPSKAWLSYNRKANQMYAVVSKSPAGTKVYVQKWTDYRWVTVKSGERFWEGRSFVFYNKASAGKYRIYMQSVTGQKFISKTLVV